MLRFTACTITLQVILYITFTGTKCICPLFFPSSCVNLFIKVWRMATSDHRGQETLLCCEPLRSHWGLVFACVCVDTRTLAHAFYRCWRLKRLGRADPIERRCVRCASTPALPSPFHNREDVDSRNTVNIACKHYTICLLQKKKVKKRNNLAP